MKIKESRNLTHPDHITDNAGLQSFDGLPTPLIRQLPMTTPPPPLPPQTITKGQGTLQRLVLILPPVVLTWAAGFRDLIVDGLWRDLHHSDDMRSRKPHTFINGTS